MCQRELCQSDMGTSRQNEQLMSKDDLTRIRTGDEDHRDTGRESSITSTHSVCYDYKTKTKERSCVIIMQKKRSTDSFIMFMTETPPSGHCKNFLNFVIMIKITHIKIVAQWTSWEVWREWSGEVGAAWVLKWHQIEQQITERWVPCPEMPPDDMEIQQGTVTLIKGDRWHSDRDTIWQTSQLRIAEVDWYWLVIKRTEAPTGGGSRSVSDVVKKTNIGPKSHGVLARTLRRGTERREENDE